MSIEFEIAASKIVAAFEQGRFRDAVLLALPLNKSMFTPDALAAVNLNLLSILFAHDPPAILGSIKPEYLKPLRIAAGLDILGLGKASERYLPKETRTGSRHEPAIAVRLCVASAYHLRRMAQFRETDVVHVRIRGLQENGCAECRAIHGRIYTLRAAPQLPFEKCTCESGCRCVALAVLD